MTLRSLLGRRALGSARLRWSSLVVSAAAALGVSRASAQDRVANEEPRLRGGAHASLGGAAALPVFSAGVGLGAELGCQLVRWLAVSAEAYGETGLLAGRARVGLVMQVAPVRLLELSLGGGVGGMYVANFVYPTETASLGSLVLRGTVRLSQDGELFGQRTPWDLTLGAEGEVGFTFAGSYLDEQHQSLALALGTQVRGGRLFVGFLL